MQPARWVLALGGGLIALYMLAQLCEAIPALRGCEAILPRLRELASDPAGLASQLNASATLIPAGEFRMGSDTGRADERPEHSVYLDAFEIDCFEVTQAQFALFLQATGRRAPDYWSGQVYPAGQAAYPVVGVPWSEADAFCHWIGKRLPTEAEWEKAARGLDGRLYPWGNRWDPARANVYLGPGLPDDRNAAAAPERVWEAAWDFLRVAPARPGQPALTPVGSFPQGQSPFGVMDMAGNASEWVADWYNWSDYSGLPSRNPLVTGPHWNHVVRGSAWYDPAGNAAWVVTMSRVSARSSSHVTRDPRIGFRCARSVETTGVESQ